MHPACLCPTQLLTIASATLSYLTTRPSFQPLHPDLPVTFKSPHADSRAVVEASKRELLADLVRKAKQVEYLVGVLPERETDGGAAHERRLGALQAEADVVNEEYAVAAREAGASSPGEIPPATNASADAPAALRDHLQNGCSRRSRSR